MIRGGAIRVINRGVAGWKAAQIDADATAVAALKTKQIITGIGINDGVADVTSPIAFRTSLDSAVGKYQSGNPNATVWLVSPGLWGEKYLPDGSALNNQWDTQIDAIAEQVRLCAIANGCIWVPTRPQLLAYEVAHNTSVPGGLDYGVIMDTGVNRLHPNDTGKLVICNAFMEQVVIAAS